MHYYLYTTGCKANQWDSVVMENLLGKAGHQPESLDRADVIIMNACTLTKGAERDIRRIINRARHANERAQIILAGCHGQVFPERTFGADTVLGQEERFHIEEFFGRKGTFVGPGRTFALDKGDPETVPKGKTRLFYKVQDGCDKFCSYCIVPFARGAVRSRPLTEIAGMMCSVAEKGFREVVLTGIEIAAYRDPGCGTGLTGLLRTLESVVTPPRIRISSIDPSAIDGELIGLLKTSSKIASHLHIPLQSGSDRILTSMRRAYRRNNIIEIVKQLKKEIPSIGIGMDVIVGFPGEDEAAFEETYRFIEELDVYYLHVFPFSARQGTMAFSMEGQVPEAVKKERVMRLRTLDVAMRERFYRRHIGKSLTIIPEARVYRGKLMRGYTENYIPAMIDVRKSLENKLVKVTIRELRDGLPMAEVDTKEGV